jgi:hypothetical protein
MVPAKAIKRVLSESVRKTVAAAVMPATADPHARNMILVTASHVGPMEVASFQGVRVAAAVTQGTAGIAARMTRVTISTVGPMGNAKFQGALAAAAVTQGTGGLPRAQVRTSCSTES